MGNLLRLFSALSDRNRLRIIAALREYNDLCACQVVELLQVTGATTSKHLSILQQVGLISSYKEGRWVHYQLDKSNKDFAQVMAWLEDHLQHTDVVKKDEIALRNIMTFGREEISRKQRGETCCSG